MHYGTNLFDTVQCGSFEDWVMEGADKEAIFYEIVFFIIVGGFIIMCIATDTEINH